MAKSGKHSAGLLLFKRMDGILRVFLVHPGGPFWAKKDDGAWSIAKGEYTEAEDPLTAAQREFFEETGVEPSGEFLPLTPLKQKSGKLISAWAVEGDCDPATLHSNTFTMEWPPRSGQQKEFPEVDRAGWFSASTARIKLNPGQVGFVDLLASRFPSLAMAEAPPQATRDSRDDQQSLF